MGSRLAGTNRVRWGQMLLVSTAFVLFMSLIGHAAPTVPDDARTAVVGWLRSNPAPMGAALGQQVRQVQTFPDDQGTPMYYVVYLAPSGFVIVSADDEVEPIVGFADSGTYDPSDDNPLGALVAKDLPGRRDAAGKGKALKPAPRQVDTQAKAKWKHLRDLATSDTGIEMGVPSISDVRVPPLTQSTWNQQTAGVNACYNYYVPPGPDASAANYPCGCVATAAAQLMRFWQFPATGIGTQNFSITVDGSSRMATTRGGNGAGGPYSWANMVLTPSGSTTLAQRQAIGALCFDAGISVNMNYRAGSSGGSGTDTLKLKTALTGTFGYANAIKGYNSGSNIGSGLNGMLNPNLDAGFPAILGITGSSGGHAIVADGYGYDASTLYHHLNMGWGGADTAWYNLPDIDATIAFTSVYKCVYNVYVSGAGEIISGRVATSGGIPIPGASVTATRTGGGTYTATTNANGIYALARIPSASTYTVSVSKSGYSFTQQTVPTGNSSDNSSTSGNVWGVDFVDGGVVNHRPVLSNARISPSVGGTSTTFEFLVDYYDQDGNPPDAAYRDVYIDGAEYAMTLKSGVPSNGTYRYATTLSLGNHYTSFFFADSLGAPSNNPWLNGPIVSNGCFVHIDFQVEDGPAGEDIAIEIGTGSDPLYLDWTTYSPSELPVDFGLASNQYLRLVAYARSNNHTARDPEWDVTCDNQPTQQLSSGAGFWVLPYQQVQAVAKFTYTPVSYTINGTIAGIPTLPSSTLVRLTSPVQQMEVNSTSGSFAFSGVYGGVPVIVSFSAPGYGFSPSTLSFPNLTSSQTGQLVNAYPLDRMAPTMRLLSVPGRVIESSVVPFTWTGQDDSTPTGSIQYQYKLDGVDPDWMPSPGVWTSNTSTTYNLPNGVYSFWLRAKDQAGNMNLAPIIYVFAVNAAPKVTDAVRTSQSIWSSRVTLQTPVGAPIVSSTFVLLPEHAGMVDAELVPVQIHQAGNLTPFGANGIVATKMGLPVKIVDAPASGKRLGWLVTLPAQPPAGQAVSYDVIWGKIKYFGWQEKHYVDTRLANKDGGERYLGENGVVYALAERNINNGGLYGWDYDGFLYAMTANESGTIFPETFLRFVKGQGRTSTKSPGEYTLFDLLPGFAHPLNGTIYCFSTAEKRVYDGTTAHYNSRYQYDAFTPGGQNAGPKESPWKAIDTSDGKPAGPCLLGDHLWFTGKNRLPDPDQAWFAIVDGALNVVKPETVFATVANADSTSLYTVEAPARVGSQMALLWSKFWRVTVNSNYYDRCQIYYQIRNQAGDLVRDTTSLTPIASPSLEYDEGWNVSWLLTTNSGKLWIAIDHDGPAGWEYYYAILNADGSIYKPLTKLPAAWSLQYCDQDGYVWVGQSSQVLLLHDDGTPVAPARPVAFMPWSLSSPLLASLDEWGYRLCDRWSPQVLQVDVPAMARRSRMQLFDLNLWSNELHTVNPMIKKGNATLWSHTGTFDSFSTADTSASLAPGGNVLTMTQNDLQGGQILVTFKTARVGDVDGDDLVDVVDLLYLVDAFGTYRGDYKYDLWCDFNCDDAVDVADLLDLVYNFGT